MLRRILACFALITGLAAAGAPLSADTIESLSQQVGTSKPAPANGCVEVCECSPVQAGKVGRKGQTTRCKPGKPLVIYIPTVQFGPDRAFE